MTCCNQDGPRKQRHQHVDSENVVVCPSCRGKGLYFDRFLQKHDGRDCEACDGKGRLIQKITYHRMADSVDGHAPTEEEGRQQP